MNAQKAPPSRDAPRPLPKRFYKTVGVESKDGVSSVVLDGKPVRTPGGRPLEVPSRQLAEAVAAEWRAQGERIDHATMPLTRHVNTVLDGIVGREAEVRAEIVKYAGTDLLCYRAETPAELVRRQASQWDPVLDWANDTLGVAFVQARGVMAIDQSEATLGRIASRVGALDAFRLSALHVMTTLMGSSVLALAVLHGRLSAEAAWSAAHVDEDWQIEQWGEDAEAGARRQRRREDMLAAARLLHLLDGP